MVLEGTNKTKLYLKQNELKKKKREKIIKPNADTVPGVKHSVSLLEQAAGQSCQLTTFPLKNIHGCFYSNPSQWKKKNQNAKSWDSWALLSSMDGLVRCICPARQKNYTCT